jgi:hypothetical protein
MQLVQANQEDIDRFIKDLETHRKMAHNVIAQAQAKQANLYNSKCRSLSFQVGQRVLINPHLLEWLESKGTGVKLRQQWIGPYIVLDRVSQNTYRLQLPKSFPGSNIINLEHLWPYVPSPQRFGAQVELPNTCQFLQLGKQQDIKDIVGHRFDRHWKQIVYKTSFRGYSSLADKWLTVRHLRDVPNVL